MKKKTKPIVRLINLTPHPVEVGKLVIPMSGMVARVEENKKSVDTLTIKNPSLTKNPGDPETYDISVVNKKWVGTNGLPPEQENTVYVVSSLVVVANPQRTDLITPDSTTIKRRKKCICAVFIRRDPKPDVDVWEILKDVSRTHNIPVKWPCDQIGMELAAKMGLEIPEC